MLDETSISDKECIEVETGSPKLQSIESGGKSTSLLTDH
jgi:hypothetical protein